MTNQEAIEIFGELKKCYLGGIVDAIDIAIETLKAQEPRVMTLEEVKRFVYGAPYIIETNKPREEPCLMYGLYSHQGVNGCFYFAFTDARSHFF